MSGRFSVYGPLSGLSEPLRFAFFSARYPQFGLSAPFPPRL
jgi:hypothetical protein